MKECVNLRAAEQPPAWPHVAAAVAPRCPAKTSEIRSLLAAVRADVPEFRRAESLAYPLAGRIGLIVMAMAQGVMRGPQDLADYAATLRQGQLGALRLHADRQSGARRCPGKTTFDRVLTAVADDALERVLRR